MLEQSMLICVCGSVIDHEMSVFCAWDTHLPSHSIHLSDSLHVSFSHPEGSLAFISPNSLVQLYYQLLTPCYFPAQLALPDNKEAIRLMVCTIRADELQVWTHSVWSCNWKIWTESLILKCATSVWTTSHTWLNLITLCCLHGTCVLSPRPLVQHSNLTFSPRLLPC